MSRLSPDRRTWPIYESADLVQQATALGIGILQNQPFLDGNKRTAYIAMLAFLELNGFTIKAEPLDIAHLLVATAERSNELEKATAEFASWLRERLIPLDE